MAKNIVPKLSEVATETAETLVTVAYFSAGKARGFKTSSKSTFP